MAQLMMPSSNLSTGFEELYSTIIGNTVSLLHRDSSVLSPEMNERTGEICHTFTSGISFTFDMQDTLAMPMLRKFYPKTAAAEAAWFTLGTKDSTFIKKYCPIWDKFTEDDGVTVNAAYGYRWRKHFGRDQLMDLTTSLFLNPSNRRTVVSAWDPADDGLMNVGTKNVPCPFALTAYIVNRKLMLGYFIRSSDLYVGLPYDIMCTDYVADALVAELRQRAAQTISSYSSVSMIPEAELDKLSMLATLERGSLTTFISNPHLYDKHVELAKEALKARRNNMTSYREVCRIEGLTMAPRMPGWSFTQIENDPDAYVEHVGSLFKNCVKSTCSQRPEVAV